MGWQVSWMPWETGEGQQAEILSPGNYSSERREKPTVQERVSGTLSFKKGSLER